MDNMKNYFAYGSNMRSKRLEDRCPSAKFMAVGYVKNFELNFNKKSRDGSGKANLVKVKNDNKVVWGVVFSISEQDLEKLDRVESGYERTYAEVYFDNRVEKCYTYIATKDLKNDLEPYDWYLQHCLRGAEEHKLSDNYIKFIQSFKSKPDPKQNRVNR